MRKSFLLAFLCLLFAQCVNKEVRLPLLRHEGIGQIQNHSGIWIFYETEGQEIKAVINKNNKLQNTHWIFHIDKRLPMGEIAPLLNSMQKDHDKDSMHKKEGMRNYFSFADSDNKKMSLLPFAKTSYTLIDDETKAQRTGDPCSILLEISNYGFAIKGRETALTQLENLQREVPDCEVETEVRIQLIYHWDLDYQQYLEAKAGLRDNGIFTSEIEWVIRKK